MYPVRNGIFDLVCTEMLRVQANEPGVNERVAKQPAQQQYMGGELLLMYTWVVFFSVGYAHC